MTTTTTLFEHDLDPHPECHVASVWLFNYKAAADLKLELGRRLHVFIGDNGAGKTTVLDGIAAGLAKIAGKAGLKKLGAARVQVGLHVVRRKEGEFAMQSAVVTWLGSGRCIDDYEVQDSTLPVFLGDLFVKPPLEDGNAIHWFNRLWTERVSVDADDYIPVFAYYTTSRAAVPAAPTTKGVGIRTRRGAIVGAFGARSSYSDLVAWFSAKEAAELYEMRRTGDTRYRDPEVEVVRKAVTQLVPSVTSLSYDPGTGHLRADTADETGKGSFTLDELSGGGRVMVAMAADLARRMIQANPHLGLDSPAIVLIDELDLHLHPRWQATVIDDLMRTFPKTQFIVSTHSEQIIGAVPSHLVHAVRVEADGIRAYPIEDLEGATYDRVLKHVMHLEDGRSAKHQRLLDEYWSYVNAGDGEEQKALALRRQLDAIYPGTEPSLVRADVVIRRKRALGGSKK